MRRRASAEATCDSCWLFHLTVDLRFSPPDPPMQKPILNDGGNDDEMRCDVAPADGDETSQYMLRVDASERNAELLDLARRCGAFDVRIEHLAVGDYFIAEEILVERKTYADFAVSLADGRLFPQAAALSRSPHRSVVLLEGPRPRQMPDVQPHALRGALVSLAIMGRLPVLIARDPADSLQILRVLAHQIRKTHDEILRRYDRKPKRLASKKLYVLQGLPGVGPALAHRLLSHFGSVEHVIAADQAALARVRGIGRTKAARIKELVG